ncbi:ATP12 family chaperone protein [Minwuia sp.]|uniref:ATP12 family chaperone protein n=1 Tax=Minwuia sp. TaxID=2493630 RepID=UPI003A8F0379
MKRFYKSAGVVEDGGGFLVQLDGRPIHTFLRRPFALPTRALAEAVAREWDDQPEEIDRMAMPLNRMAGTAIDGLAGKRAETVDAVAKYAETDMVCYWADAPQSLIEQQQATWRPLLDWTEERFGARLQVTSGVLPVAQDAAALDRLKMAVDAMDDFKLVALSVATGTAGSLVIGLALVEGHIDALRAFEAAQLDETWQLSEWGEDEQATQRRNRVLAEFGHVEALIEGLRN